MIWTTLVDLASPMLYAKIQPLKKKILTYGIVIILFNSAEPFEQIDNTPSTESHI